MSKIVKKSRGSIEGLRRHHLDKEQSTQDALIRSFQNLKKEKPHKVLTKTELWKNAGLKSGMALSNPRHANILDLFERHNADARQTLLTSPDGSSERKTTRETLRALRAQIAELTAQRDKAADEAQDYRLQVENLQALIGRLEAERDKLSEKLVRLGVKI